MKSIQFSTLHRLYICRHSWIPVLLLIFIDWYKSPYYIMGHIINLGSIFFLFALVWNLAYFDYSLCPVWSVYMQYLRCCDHSNKWLFLIIQQAEVLLNFFGECTIHDMRVKETLHRIGHANSIIRRAQSIATYIYVLVWYIHYFREYGIIDAKIDICFIAWQYTPYDKLSLTVFLGIEWGQPLIQITHGTPVFKNGSYSFGIY